MRAIRRLDAAVKAEVTADYNGLPQARIAEHHGAAHVFTAGLVELEAWFTVLSGRITQRPAGPGVVLWTLDTQISDTDATPVRVHALAVDTDQLDAQLANAVA